MKRLFSLCTMLAIVSMMLTVVSCRSVKESTNVHNSNVRKESDSLVTKACSIEQDSFIYYRMLADSLTSKMNTISNKYKSLYAKDSVMINQCRFDSISIRDSSWSVINDDGTVTHYKNTEKERYSYQQLDKYKENIVRESQHTIDSLIMENERLKFTNDSLHDITKEYDYMMYYDVAKDSVVNDSTEYTIVKQEKTFFEKLKDNTEKTAICLLVILAIIAVTCYIYKKKE